MTTLNLRGDFLRPTNNTNPGLNQMDNFPNMPQGIMDTQNNFNQFDPYEKLSPFTKFDPYANVSSFGGNGLSFNAPAVADGMRNQNPFINTQKQSSGFPNGQSSGFRNGQWIDNSNAGAIQSAKDRAEYEIRTFGKASAAALKAYEDANGDNDGISGEQTRYMNKRGVPSAAQWSSHVGELTDRIAEQKYGEAGRSIKPWTYTPQMAANKAVQESGRDFHIMGRPSESTIVPSSQERLDNFRTFMKDSDARRAAWSKEHPDNITDEEAETKIGFNQDMLNFLRTTYGMDNMQRTQGKMLTYQPTYASQNQNPYISSGYVPGQQDTLQPLQPPDPYKFSPSGSANFSPYEQTAMRTPNFKPRR